MKRFLHAVLLLLPLLSFCQPESKASYSESGRYTVNKLEVTDAIDESRNNRLVPVKMLYPAEKGVFPLIVISHGAGGSWDSHYLLAQHLASHGYVVCCVEHVGSNTKTLKKSFRIFKNLDDMLHDGNEVLGRPKDISFAIDLGTRLNASNEKVKGKVDLENIGVLGHSFGAFTSMVVGGIQPALDWLEPRSKYGSGLASGLKDARVKACVALSPQGVGEPFFLKESFKSLSAPLLGITGTNDRQQNGQPAINRYQAFDLWGSTGNSYFVWLANAHHLDFADGDAEVNQGLKSKNRRSVQQVVRAASLLFFNANLKHDKIAGTLMNQMGLSPYLSGEVNKIEVRQR